MEFLSNFVAWERFLWECVNEIDKDLTDFDLHKWYSSACVLWEHKIWKNLFEYQQKHSKKLVVSLNLMKNSPENPSQYKSLHSNSTKCHKFVCKKVDNNTKSLQEQHHSL